MEASYPASDEIVIFPHHEPADAFGFVPRNAFLIKSREPILVETGIPPQADAFMRDLREQIDLEDLRWILLTHEDLDHSGAVVPLMQAAPNARLVLSFLSISKGGAGDPRAYMDRSR